MARGRAGGHSLSRGADASACVPCVLACMLMCLHPRTPARRCSGGTLMWNRHGEDGSKVVFIFAGTFTRQVRRGERGRNACGVCLLAGSHSGPAHAPGREGCVGVLRRACCTQVQCSLRKSDTKASSAPHISVYF